MGEFRHQASSRLRGQRFARQRGGGRGGALRDVHKIGGHGSSQIFFNFLIFKVFFSDGGGVLENRKTASDDTQVSLGISGILATVVFVRKKMSVYPQREPYPLSVLYVCHFIVGASCSVIYPLALSTKPLLDSSV